MSYTSNRLGYELGNFLIPENTNLEYFFVLLQKTTHYDDDGEKFLVKVGKTRFLEYDFSTSCREVLVYSIDTGSFTLFEFELKERSDGVKYFDAESFLNKLELKYNGIDTRGYRYFKREMRTRVQTEFILDKENQKISSIHRRINADDYETITTYSYRTASCISRDEMYLLAEKGFFLSIDVGTFSTGEHEIIYCPTKEEMQEYIAREFQATDCKDIIRIPFEDLMRPHSFQMESRMGCSVSKLRCQLFHKNLEELYKKIDRVGVEDGNGNPVKLSDYIKSAESEEDIREIIDIYNEYF